MLSQRQSFSNINLPPVPATSNPQGILVMRDGVLSSVDDLDLDTSGYQVFDQDDGQSYYENDQKDVDAVFRPAIDTPFSLQAFDILEMGGSVENAILLD